MRIARSACQLFSTCFTNVTKRGSRCFTILSAIAAPVLLVTTNAPLYAASGDRPITYKHGLIVVRYSAMTNGVWYDYEGSPIPSGTPTTQLETGLYSSCTEAVNALPGLWGLRDIYTGDVHPATYLAITQQPPKPYPAYPAQGLYAYTIKSDFRRAGERVVDYIPSWCRSLRVCTTSGEPVIDSESFAACTRCPAGSAVTGPVAELHDKCDNGCLLENLSPSEDNQWVSTLQGTRTGAECRDTSTNGVKVEKMLACGTAGSSEYSTQTDHPIDFALGNKFFRETDYRGTGSFPIRFTRTYNSLDLGWRFNYTQRIDRLGLDKVAVRRPGGQSYEFQLKNGAWTPDPDVTSRLAWEAEAYAGEGGWRYTQANNTQEYFDAEGRLLRIENPQGRVQTVTYRSDGKVMTIEGPEGDVLSVTFNDRLTQPLSLTDKTGRTTVYDFDGAILRQVTYPEGTTKQYRYEKADRPWLITGIIDENGHRSHTVDYDAQGRAIMSELADGADRVDIEYGSNGTTTVTNALGKKTRFYFQTIHGVRKIVRLEGEPTATCQGTAMAYRFNGNGFLTEKTDAEGNVTTYSRDENGLVLSQTEAKGKEEVRTTITEWDRALRKPLLITRATSQTRYTYDEAGRTLTRTLIDRQTGAERTTGYTYNAQGLLETVNGPREDVADLTTYTYDAVGRLTQVTNALGHTTTILSRDAYGRPLITGDANGLPTTLSYDDKGRIKKRTVGSQTTTLDYDAVGNLITVTNPDGTDLRYRYDNADRLIGIEDNHGNTITYTLDALGNKTSEKVKDSTGRLVRLQQKTYDELGRLLTSVGAQDQTTSYGYDRNDNLIRTIDPLWQVYENAYDGLNRLIQQSDPLGNTTDFAYDDEDRLIKVIDPNGNATTYEYDGLGNLAAQHSPDTGTTVYTHDTAGNVTGKTDAKGQTTQYRYDVLNRLTQTDFADSTTTSYTYDTCTHGIGRLCEVTDSSGSTTWEYDSDGHTISRTQTPALEGITTNLTTQYRFNSAGQPSGITYPSGMMVEYHYTDGKLSTVTVNGAPLLTDITHQPFGPITGWTWANGSHSQRGYDLDGRLISQSLGKTTRTLSYDDNGNITAITEPADTQVFDYDALNRLISANDSTFKLAWQYDANGNRLSETDAGIVTPYTTETTSNRLMAIGDTPYQYDPNGNLIHDGEHRYQYNAQNRLATVDEGTTAEYRYNALGQRVYKRGISSPCDVNRDGDVNHNDLKQVTGKEKMPLQTDGPGKGEAKGKGQSIACIATQMNNGQGKEKENQTGSREILFAYDEHRLLGEYDTQGKVIQETVWLGNLPIATIQNGTRYFIHSDHLGTPRVITDSDNWEVWKWGSDPFGVAVADEDPDGDGVILSYDLRFPGQYYDEETGKHYNYFRDYSPGVGKYIESDQVGPVGGLNAYEYSNSNPILWSDLFGLSPEDAQKLIDEAKRFADNLTLNGERVDPGWWNNLQISCRSLGLCENEYNGCGGQSDALKEHLEEFIDKNEFDNAWVIEKIFNYPVHYNLNATSSNSDDPPLLLDPHAYIFRNLNDAFSFPLY